MRRAVFVAALYASSALAADHEEAVTAFARIMADVRTAGERCPGLVVEWDRVAAVKDRLGIADVDYFSFRRQAHDMADELAARIDNGTAGLAWCADILGRYGPHGNAAAGLVHRGD